MQDFCAFVLRLCRRTGPALGSVLLILSCVQPSDVPELDPWIPAEERRSIDLSGVFKTMEGKDVTLPSLREGKGVLFLNVWATWCGPCRYEMPSMASLYEELSDEGLHMVAVSDEDLETVRRFLVENSYPFTILVDTDNVLGRRFQIQAIPTTFIVDSQGRLAYRHTGWYEWDNPETIERLRDLIKQ